MKNIWVPLSGAIAQQRKVDTHANNVANANTPGFKKDSLVFKEHLTALSKDHGDIHIPRHEFSPKDFYHSQGQENAMVKTDGHYTNFSQGTLSPTSNPLDLALHGPGLYEFLTPHGIRFGRRGSFSLNSEGILVNEKGDFVLGKQSGPEPDPDPKNRLINLEGARRLSVNLQGEIYSGQQQRATLSVVEFPDLTQLRKVGGSYFVNSLQTNTPLSARSTSVRQGMVEESNVNVVQEMSELIKAHRHFEGIQRAIKTYDEISGKIVNEISRL